MRNRNKPFGASLDHLTEEGNMVMIPMIRRIVSAYEMQRLSHRLRHLLHQQSNAVASPVLAMAPAQLQFHQQQCNHKDFSDRNWSTAVALAVVATVATTDGESSLSIDQQTCECESLHDKAIQQTISSVSEQQDQLGPYFDSDYETKNLLGSGTFGMVMQCVNKKDGRMAAVKMIQELHDSKDEVERETETLSAIEEIGGHESIVRYYGSYCHDGFHYIVTEYIPGESLFEFVEKHRQVDVPTALSLVAQLASALAFMKQCNLIHRDLKPENIMVTNSRGEEERETSDQKLELKIIDFGSAGNLSEVSSASQPMTLSGTRCYWSPEMLLHQQMTPAMDMWSLGCILYILITGRHPFDLMGSSSEEQIVQRITTDSASFLHPVWQNVSNDVKDLIRGLLEKDPSLRLSVEDVLSHPSIITALNAF